MDEVRRPDDGELCGYVEQRGDRWRALVVFGAALGEHPTRDDAVAHVLTEGLAALTDRWTLRSQERGVDEVVCIQEANASGVTVALGYYSMPGVPTMTISAAEVASGEWSFSR